MVSLLETDVKEDHRDVGLMISNNGQECPLQIVFNAQKTRSTWCLQVSVTSDSQTWGRTKAKQGRKFCMNKDCQHKQF